MTEHERHEPDAVDRAAQAVKDQTPPAGPSEALAASTLEAMRREASAGPRRTLTLRITNMKRAYRLAVAAVVLLAMGLGVGWYLYHAMSPTVAFADVVRRVQNAKTFQMTVEAQMPNQSPMRMRWMFREPSSIRIEMDVPARGVTVFDLQKGRLLSLVPDQKQAMTMEVGQVPSGQQNANYLEYLRKAMEGSPRELGARTIDGRSAQGYEVQEAGSPLEIWVDRRNGDILLVRSTTPDTGLIPSVTTVMRDFVIDAELGDELFALEVPEGYATMTMPKMDTSPSTEQDLATMMGALAEQNDGVFPDSFEQAGNSRPKGDQVRMMATISKIVRGVVWMQIQQKSGQISDFHYAGGGVKLGAPSAIAWWLPKDATLYRVLRGDLTFADMPAGELPAARTTGPATLPAITDHLRVEISDSAGSNMAVSKLMVPILLRIEPADAPTTQGVSSLAPMSGLVQSGSAGGARLLIEDPRGQRAHLPVNTPATLRVVGPLAQMVGQVELTDTGKEYEVVQSPDQPGQLILREVKGASVLSTVPRVVEPDPEPAGATVEAKAGSSKWIMSTGSLPARLKFVRQNGRLILQVTSARGTRSQSAVEASASVRVLAPGGATVGTIESKEPGQTYEVRESPEPGRLELRAIEP